MCKGIRVFSVKHCESIRKRLESEPGISQIRQNQKGSKCNVTDMEAKLMLYNWARSVPRWDGQGWIWVVKVDKSINLAVRPSHSTPKGYKPIKVA